MASTNSESLSELERRAESTRAELAQTVDALHSRVSPSALKADVRSYVRENPLQAAALAVGVAYPVWRLIGSIPAPVLLIGAGLAMSKRGDNSSHGNGYQARPPSSEGMMSGLKEKASVIGSAIAGKAHDTVEGVRSMAAEKAALAADTWTGTYQSSRHAAAETAHLVADQVTDSYARTRDSLAELIERNPLLVGGIAFAAGSLLATAIPVSRQESKVMGDAADDMKRRAQHVARQGLREAKTAARQVYETAREEIGSEGLTPEAARQTARAAMEGAREAVEQTVSAAGQSGGRTGRRDKTRS